MLDMSQMMTSKKKVDAKNQKYAENWLPIKGIQNGEIILDNGLRVTGVKIRPRNLFLIMILKIMLYLI